MTDLEKIISSSLNLFCFLNIWNEPHSEYRVNIKPTMITDHSKTGVVSINGRRVALPTLNEAYYIYSISKSNFRNAFELPTMKWYRGDKLCNDHNIVLNVYTEQGRMCSLGEIHLMLFSNDNNYILAISKNMMSKLCSHTDSDKIYVTVYKDSDIANKITVYPYKVPANDVNGTYRINIATKLTEINDPSRVITYINGYQATLSSYTSIQPGDIVDIIHDENIIFDYTVDLTDINNYRIFYSEMDKMSKLLVHTPKALNPDNKVLTHNTCDFYIQRKKPEKYTTEGLYVHRTAPISVSQVTHQDFSIPMFIVDAHRDYLDTQDVQLRVVVRQHDKDNLLVRDKNYIDLLYTQNDTTIVDCIMGKVKNAPSFWKAAVLEASVYVSMMFSVPKIISEDNMYFYIEGLGYYHVISLICQRVLTSYVTDLWGNSIVCPKPYLFANRRVYPIVYHNGSKIHNERLSVTNGPEGGFTVNFLDNVYNPGDTIDIEMFLDGTRQIYDFTVTEEDRILSVGYDEYVIYEEITSTIPAKGFDTIYTKKYKKLTSYTGVVSVTFLENSITQFTFSIDAIGRTFIVQNKYCAIPLSVDAMVRPQISIGKTIAIDLMTMSDKFRPVPIFEPKSVQLFVNGRYLVNNLDYYVASVMQNDELYMHQLIIQNMSYLTGDDDTIELIVTSAEVEDQSFGFLKNDTITYTGDKKLALWFNNISTSHIEGLFELDLDNQSTHINVPKDKYRQGAPYEITTNIPRVVKEFVDEYHNNDDYDRIQELNKYFHDIEFITEGIILLPYSHKLYSSYCNTIIHDVINGVANISYDPDFDRLEQQLDKYHYLKKYDLIFNDASTIDLTYVDVFPTYSEYGPVDEQTYKLIHALVSLILPEDNFSSGEIPHVN